MCEVDDGKAISLGIAEDRDEIFLFVLFKKNLLKFDAWRLGCTRGFVRTRYAMVRD